MNIIVFYCLVVGCEHVKCKMRVRKLDRGEEKEVKKIVKRCTMTPITKVWWRSKENLRMLIL